jgi:3-deoxy-manno-octulosonate cytidylyltransferase (CMP-KDO synthetase)
MQKYVLTIPCRLKSKRFPEKLLKKFKGLEIFLHTYNRCLKACAKNKIYILTDSERIYKLCKEKKINCLLTRKNIITGSDRIASIKNILKAKYYINVQGDEPIINPSDIKKMINAINKNKNFVLNGYSRLPYKHGDIKSIPKVVLSKNNTLLYISRSKIPENYSGGKNLKIYKQVCIYVYPRKALKYFKNKKTYLEKFEDIEILRMIENNVPVKMINLSKDSFSIDLKEDLYKLQKLKNF